MLSVDRVLPCVVGLAVVDPMHCLSIGTVPPRCIGMDWEADYADKL